MAKRDEDRQLNLVTVSGETADLPSEIFEAELEEIATSRPRRLGGRPTTPEGAVNPEAIRDNLVGLALSGGGIRSATFALGVLQVLARKGILKHVDYLSTVSGGGYIGSALTWFTSVLNPESREEEQGPEYGVGEKTFPWGTEGSRDEVAGTDDPGQRSLLRYLRQHGKFLFPGAGITATSGLVIFLRGVLLNLLVWVPLAIAGMYLVLEVGDAVGWSYPEVEATSTERSPCCLECSDGTVTVNCDPPATAADESTYDPFSDGALFSRQIVIAALMAGIFVIASLIYSLRTYMVSEPKPDAPRPWYKKAVTYVTPELKSKPYSWRRWYEKWMRLPLWILAASVVVWSLPLVEHWLNDTIETAGGIGSFLGGVASGVWAFRKSASFGSNSGKKGVPIAVIATIGAGLLIYALLFWAFKWSLALYRWEGYDDWLGPITVVVVGVLLAVCSGIVVNLNFISLHRFYRDRLMETFMPSPAHARAGSTGASKAANEAFLHELWNKEQSLGPYPLVNLNLVLVDSENRTYRTRGGDNFVISPRYSGSAATGWLPSKEWLQGGMTLATAMAVSGAAANPNAGVGGQGVTRTPVVSLLMNLLNLRLGYWAKNPNCARQKGRVNHFKAAWYELGRGYAENRKFIQLSDGGHFSNLAIFELIRRKVSLIIATDAGADPDFHFGDLIVALRRIGTDLGARITFREPRNHPQTLIPYRPVNFPKDAEVTDRGYIRGHIIYTDDVIENEDGTETRTKRRGDLIFIKTTLIDDLRPEVLGYRGKNEQFPDQSTVDQFFDEEQFEAYRELGYEIGEQMIEGLKLRLVDGKLELPDDGQPEGTGGAS